MDNKIKAAMAGLAGKADKPKKAKKAKLHMHIRPSDTKGKYIVEHHMRGGDDMSTMGAAPTEHVMNNMGELQNHVAKSYGKPSVAAASPAPVAAGTPAPTMM